MNLEQLLMGILLAALIAYAAFRLQALNVSGAWAAFFLGTVVFGLGGFAWALVLMVFFISSSSLSLMFRGRKETVEEKYAKGSRRDARQVLANGGLAGVAVISHLLFSESMVPWIVYCAAFAAANADTWATELGVLNKTLPRLIHTGQVVPAGTSGGVSFAGILAAAAGSFTIALTGFCTWPLTGTVDDLRFLLSIIVLFAGFIGSLVDSWIGATIQAIYWCPQCSKETEKTPLHTCGTTTEIKRGKAWISNEWVNVFCTGSAVIMALLITLLVTTNK